MQIRYATDLSTEEYVEQRAWKEARLDDCPVHPEGGCGFSKNGTYKRKVPQGTKIAILPPPLGFGPRPELKNFKENHFQHKTGTDPPV